MANDLEHQTTLDGWRNCVVKFTGVIDTADVSWTPAFRLTDCTNNESRATLVGFRIDLVEWSLSSGLELVLEWNSADPQQIYPLAGRGRINGWNYGGFTPDRTRPGYDGALNLRTQAYAPGTIANFTIVLELVKLYTA